MRKSLHDSLPRVTMRLINSDLQSSDKEMTNPIQSEVNVSPFAKA